MKISDKIFWLIIFIIGSFSCTKVIDIHLDTSAPKLVVEGIVSNNFRETFVRISKSVEFSEPNNFPAVDNALVILKDSNTNAFDTLYETKNNEGVLIYKPHRIKGVIGHTYQLKVNVNGQQYEASSQMPDSVAFTGLKLFATNSASDTSVTFTIVPQYIDQKGVSNYYRFIQYINHKKDDGINVLNDDVGDGLPNERPIFTNTINIRLNDTVAVKMLNIDKNVYQYFYELEQNANQLGVTPSNPVSNISNGALGYFSAQYEQISVAVISDDGK